MTARALAIAWVLAFVITAALIGTLVWMDSQRTYPGTPDFTSRPVVLVGSSLLRSAIPNAITGNGLLGDGRDHRVLALGGLTVAQIVTILRQLRGGPVQTVFIETQPLIYCTANSSKTECDTVSTPTIRMLVKLFMERAAREVRFQIGKPVLPRWDDPATGPMRKFRARRSYVERYPFFPLPGRQLDEFRDAVNALQGEGKRIVLITPPRSEWEYEQIGQRQAEDIKSNAVTLARELGVEIFQPAAHWSNEHFYDFGHMNRRGRDRFQAALRDWWAGGR